MYEPHGWAAGFPTFRICMTRFAMPYRKPCCQRLADEEFAGNVPLAGRSNISKTTRDPFQLSQLARQMLASNGIACNHVRCGEYCDPRLSLAMSFATANLCIAPN